MANTYTNSACLLRPAAASRLFHQPANRSPQTRRFWPRSSAPARHPRRRDLRRRKEARRADTPRHRSGMAAPSTRKRTIGAVRVVVSDGQQDRLLGRFGISPGPVRKKEIVAPRPQMGIERLNTLFRGGLHHDPPATLKRLLQERRQHLLRRLPLEVIEEDFGHVRRACSSSRWLRRTW